MRIGFLGLGTMGEPIANNLRKAGHDLTVWNRTAAKADHIVSKGGKLARTPRECAAGKDLVFTCLSDEKALDAVLDGPGRRARRAREGRRARRPVHRGGPRRARPSRTAPRRRGSSSSRARCSARRRRRSRRRSSSWPAARRRRASAPARRCTPSRPGCSSSSDAADAALMKLCVNAVGGAMITGFGEALALGASGGLPVPHDRGGAAGLLLPLPALPHEGRADRAEGLGAALRHRARREGPAARAGGGGGAGGARSRSTRRCAGSSRTPSSAGRGDKDVAAVADLSSSWAKKK